MSGYGPTGVALPPHAAVAWADPISEEQADVRVLAVLGELRQAACPCTPEPRETDVSGVAEQYRWLAIARAASRGDCDALELLEDVAVD